MTANHVEASICFPNTLPRFCGQTFYERAGQGPRAALRAGLQRLDDRRVVRRATGKGRLIPLGMIPLWDAELAAAEVRRNAARGCFAVTFSENPHPLGLPSVHDKGRFWDPFFQACQDTGTVVCMHIGSSSRMPATSPDAPFIVSSTLTFSNAMGSMLDYIFSGTLERFPELVIAYSRGPGRLDALRASSGPTSSGPSGATTPSAPRCRTSRSSYIHHRIYGCVFDDEIGLKNRDVIGMDQICFETDYPHADSTFPHSKKVASDICTQAGLDEEETWKFLRGNAIRCLRPRALRHHE